MNTDNLSHMHFLAGYETAEEYAQARRDFLQRHSAQVQQRIRTWIAIGQENPWIRSALDPPFSELSFRICADVVELAEHILPGNWALGTAFALGEICWVNQVDGGDEWLTIKGQTPFESVTMRIHSEAMEVAQERLRDLIRRIQAATEEECRRLRY